MSDATTPPLPYTERWKADKVTYKAVNPNVADERNEPRELEGCRAIEFSMVDEAPGGGIVHDHGSREVALLMEQAAGWLRTHVGETVIGLHVQHPADGIRTRLVMTVES